MESEVGFLSGVTTRALRFVHALQHAVCRRQDTYFWLLFLVTSCWTGVIRWTLIAGVEHPSCPSSVGGSRVTVWIDKIKIKIKSGLVCGVVVLCGVVEGCADDGFSGCDSLLGMIWSGLVWTGRMSRSKSSQVRLLGQRLRSKVEVVEVVKVKVKVWSCVRQGFSAGQLLL